MLNFLYCLLSILPFVVSEMLPADHYWQVTPTIDYTDVLYAGWDQISVEKEILIYNGSAIGRTVRPVQTIALPQSQHLILLVRTPPCSPSSQQHNLPRPLQRRNR